MREVDREMLHLAMRQHGLITRRQAMGAGLTADAIRHRTKSGTWVRVHPGVYRLAAAPTTWEQRVLAACFLADGVASHRTAGVLWGIGSLRRGAPEVTIPRRRRIRLSGVRVHQSTQADRFDTHTVNAIPTTGVGRTLVDLGAVLPATIVEEAMDDARRRHLVDWIELHDALVLHSRRGRDGVGVFRSVLEDRYGEGRVPDSVFNRRVQRLIVASGLPEPEVEHEVRGPTGVFIARVDLAYPDRCVAIELDGKATHLTATAFERDRERLNGLLLAGWSVLAFTWQHFTEQPEQLVSKVSAALRQSKLRRPAAL